MLATPVVPALSRVAAGAAMPTQTRVETGPQAIPSELRPWLQPLGSGSSPQALAPATGPLLYPLSSASNPQVLAPAPGTWLQAPLRGIMGQMKKQKKIALCGIIGHRPLWGHCPIYSSTNIQITLDGASGIADHITLGRLFFDAPTDHASL